MKDIILITNYWHFEIEKASSRYLTLANMIVEKGMNLEVISSSFYHATKSQREYNREFLSSFPYKVSLIKEKGYTKNISFKRLISHRNFANNIVKYLKERKTPDLIYCVVPSLAVADKVSSYAKRNSIKLIIDVQDLWPEAFKMIFNFPIINKPIFTPMKLKANKVYASADEIVAVSQTYVDRAMSVNNKCIKGHSVYLGMELEKFNQYASQELEINKPNKEKWIAYVGTLGHSYDIKSVIDALKILKEKDESNIKFIVMGDGPYRKKFEDYAKKQRIEAVFKGKLNYQEMVTTLCNCDIAVNPIVKNSAASIINKHADYLAAGLPIINTQESFEFRELIKNNNIGLNCENNNAVDLAKKIMILLKNDKMRHEMGFNARKLAETRFDRKQEYKKIVDLITQV